MPTTTPDRRSARTEYDSVAFHSDLAARQRARLRPAPHAPDFEQWLHEDIAARRLEHGFIERERERVATQARLAPTSPDAFVEWFEGLREAGPGQGDPLFPWLAATATREEMRWFLGQEISGEAGFDDLVAMTQVKLPARAKVEMARNYWDEMGCGHEGGMHGRLLGTLARHFSLAGSANDENYAAVEPCWEALALGNLMVALATDRRLAWHSVGALGVIELTASGRSEFVNRGLKRLDVPGEARRYFALHATLDVKHSLLWNREVIVPLVEEFPEAAGAMAEGALMRLEAGARCFRRYRTALWSVTAARQS
ncbi:MAG: iron-containing redox enzyme family protein [Myxococcota bacterium]|nr:iron-containing redox enzyme family protein [Myxococcota bacterium]